MSQNQPTNATDEVFDSAPPDRPRRKFGAFKFITNPIMLESGATYSVPGVFDRDGNLVQFAGKRRPTQGERASTYHVIIVMKAKNQSGEEYQTYKHWVQFDEHYKKIVQPSIVATFGQPASKVIKPNSGTWVYAAVESVTTGESYTGRDGNEYETYAWRFITYYKTKQEKDDAEVAFFAGGDESAPASDGSIPADVIAKAKKVFNAIGNNVDTFRTLVADDPNLSKYNADELIAAVSA